MQLARSALDTCATHITRPEPIRVRGGVLVRTGGGCGGERTRRMKGKKRKEGANRKKLQLQIGLFFVSHVDQSFAA